VRGIGWRTSPEGHAHLLNIREPSRVERPFAEGASVCRRSQGHRSVPCMWCSGVRPPLERVGVDPVKSGVRMFGGFMNGPVRER
jgi:hypothetical protein